MTDRAHPSRQAGRVRAGGSASGPALGPASGPALGPALGPASGPGSPPLEALLDEALRPQAPVGLADRVFAASRPHLLRRAGEPAVVGTIGRGVPSATSRWRTAAGRLAMAASLAIVCGFGIWAARPGMHVAGSPSIVGGPGLVTPAPEILEASLPTATDWQILASSTVDAEYRELDALIDGEPFTFDDHAVSFEIAALLRELED